MEKFPRGTLKTFVLIDLIHQSSVSIMHLFCVIIHVYYKWIFNILHSNFKKIRANLLIKLWQINILQRSSLFDNKIFSLLISKPQVLVNFLNTSKTNILGTILIIVLSWTRGLKNLTIAYCFKFYYYYLNIKCDMFNIIVFIEERSTYRLQLKTLKKIL